ncbi:MAG TPA: hypothetical protein VGR16_07715 [Thermomicrobiales bacterium]|nr:hypothetical protein [Thermomicrobiales bacterium]
MAIMRVLVSNEPRVYREVLAAALQEMRPAAEVEMVDPTALDAEIVSKKPGLVFCSALTDAIRRGASAWVLLYPEGEGRAVLGVGNRERDIANVDFSALLAVVDQAAARASTDGPPTTGVAPS